MNLDILDSWNIRENKDFFHVATHGLEGFSNLRNTMFNNDLQWAGLWCPSKHRFGWRWAGPDIGFEVSAGFCR